MYILTKYFARLLNEHHLTLSSLPPTEEAVNEVKRQAVAELQKAVAAAEAKANELISHERSKMEREVTSARRVAQEEYLGTLNQQEEASEVGSPPHHLLRFFLRKNVLLLRDV